MIDITGWLFPERENRRRPEYLIRPILLLQGGVYWWRRLSPSINPESDSAKIKSMLGKETHSRALPNACSPSRRNLRYGRVRGRFRRRRQSRLYRIWRIFRLILRVYLIRIR